MRAEMDDFFSRMDEPADAFALRKEPLERPNGLKETKSIRFLSQPCFDLGGLKRLLQSRIAWPARGGHCRNGSFRCRVFAVNWLKLLMEAERPRKCSRPLANK